MARFRSTDGDTNGGRREKRRRRIVEKIVDIFPLCRVGMFSTNTTRRSFHILPRGSSSAIAGVRLARLGLGRLEAPVDLVRPGCIVECQDRPVSRALGLVNVIASLVQSDVLHVGADCVFREDELERWARLEQFINHVHQGRRPTSVSVAKFDHPKVLG